ncbi:MAG: 50S ribosomal protein L22 [Halodesulfurarchaeum sp.]
MGISYSIDVDPETTAKAMLRERPMSLKHSKAVARAINGKSVGDARSFLHAVKDGERSVPVRQHNSNVGHRSDIDGWDAGRFPEKVSEEFLSLLENVSNNADQAGFDPDWMQIVHVAPHKVGENRGRKPRAFGRASEWNTTLVDVEIVVQDPREVSE